MTVEKQEMDHANLTCKRKPAAVLKGKLISWTDNDWPLSTKQLVQESNERMCVVVSDFTLQQVMAFWDLLIFFHPGP